MCVEPVDQHSIIDYMRANNILISQYIICYSLRLVLRLLPGLFVFVTVRCVFVAFRLDLVAFCLDLVVFR